MRLAWQLTNACKFTSRGKITVSARPAEEYVEVSIADQGVGISKDALSRIFEPFEQAEESVRAACARRNLLTIAPNSGCECDFP